MTILYYFLKNSNMRIQFSPATVTPVLSGTPTSGLEVQWMENQYRTANSNAIAGSVSLFQSVAFNTDDLLELTRQPLNEYVVFTNFNCSFNGVERSTLMAVGISNMEYIQTGSNDLILVATHFDLPQFQGTLDLFECSHPTSPNKQFDWNYRAFNNKTIDELTIRVVRSSFENGNMFASVRFERTDLERIMNPPTGVCDKVAFVPIKLECRKEESVVGIREVSFQQDVTLIAFPLDSNNVVLPLQESGRQAVPFSGDAWPPRYPHWQF